MKKLWFITRLYFLCGKKHDANAYFIAVSRSTSGCPKEESESKCYLLTRSFITLRVPLLDPLLPTPYILVFLRVLSLTLYFMLPQLAICPFPRPSCYLCADASTALSPALIPPPSQLQTCIPAGFHVSSYNARHMKTFIKK